MEKKLVYINDDFKKTIDKKNNEINKLKLEI